MFKDFLKALDPIPDDSLTQRIEKEASSDKYFMQLGGAILFMIGFIIVLFFLLIKNHADQAHPAFVLDGKGGANQVVTLNYPVQSMKNVQSWLGEAIMASYSFTFSKYDEQLAAAEYYFTPEGYVTYKQSLLTNKVEEVIKAKNLQVSIIPLSNPVWINGGTLGDGEFWRFRVPVLINYVGSKENISRKFLIEILIVRVPGYKNHKALGIAEFNMTTF